MELHKAKTTEQIKYQFLGDPDLDNLDDTNFDDIWLWTDMDTFRQIPEIGPKSINIIWLAQHMRRD